MECVVCESDRWETVFTYTTPDKYEQWVRLRDIHRKWLWCNTCGMLQQHHNYDMSDLERIYTDGYRHPKFCGETISEAFERINLIPDNENSQRIEWLSKTRFRTILDVGAGLGVFPAALCRLGKKVKTTELNRDSRKFIKSLSIPCTKKPPREKFDMVSLVHVLEHFEDPYPILKDIKSNLKPDGKLFVEVPSAEGFNYLEQDSDDFNSCHCLSFSTLTLGKVLIKAGYEVLDMDELHYSGRNLKRLVGICQTN